MPIAPPSLRHPHPRDAERVKSRLSPAYLPADRSKAMSVGDEEKKPEGLNRDHRRTTMLSLNLKSTDWHSTLMGVEEGRRWVRDVEVCVRERKKDGGKRKQESYQSCCQSLGQVVIRKAVWQRLVSISPSLSFSISHSHTHKAGERLCCVPLCHPWVNAVQVRWTAWQPFVDCILGQKDERRPGEKYIRKREFWFCSCRLSVWFHCHGA